MTPALLALDAIAVSSDNPRRTFDPQALRELAASIRAQGVLQPVLVRPLATPNGKTHELVAGERRLRAAKEAGLDAIPVHIRPMSDEEAAQARIVENLQRADLTPLEEAETYRGLREQGRTAEEIAALVAKSTAYVYLRLELLTLPDAARKALARGELGVSTALLLARIPDEASREQATKEVLAGSGYGDTEPMTYKRAHDHIVRNYMLVLAQAPFAVDDETLVPAAGTCNACPHRSGNPRELFADVKGKDICTNPACFAQKREAAWQRQAEAARSAGWTVLDEKAEKKVFPYGSQPAHEAKVIDLDSRCLHDEKNRSWRQLLRKREVPVTLARDPSWQPHQLVPLAVAVEAVRAAHPTIAESYDATSKAASAETKAEERERQRITGLARRNAVAEIVRMAEAKALSLDAWKLVATLLLGEVWSASLTAVAQRREIVAKGDRPLDALRTYIDRLNGEGALRGLVLELLLTRRDTYAPDLSDSLKRAGAVYGLDLKTILRDAKKEVRAARASKGRGK